VAVEALAPAGLLVAVVPAAPVVPLAAARAAVAVLAASNEHTARTRAGRGCPRPALVLRRRSRMLWRLTAQMRRASDAPQSRQKGRSAARGTVGDTEPNRGRRWAADPCIKSEPGPPSEPRPPSQRGQGGTAPHPVPYKYKRIDALRVTFSGAVPATSACGIRRRATFHVESLNPWNRHNTRSYSRAGWPRSCWARSFNAVSRPGGSAVAAIDDQTRISHGRTAVRKSSS
jgi:hypothetical protein